MALTELIREVADSKDSKKLVINPQGQLVVEATHWFDIFTGWYEDKKVMNYIIDHKDQLYSESKQDFSDGKSVAQLQVTLDKIAEGTGLRGQVPDVTGHVFSNWMDSLSDEVKSQPLNKLFLPGTHDSTAYTLDFSTPIEHKAAKGNDQALSVGSKLLN